MAPHGESCPTRILHALALPARLSNPGAAELRRGLYVDCETTGFSPAHDAVIELAMLPFTYTLEGSVVEVLHDEAQVHRSDPGRPLPAEITHLTGLTDDDVRGERIDVEAASALIERSGLVVAHNARFDRPFVERVLPDSTPHRELQRAASRRTARLHRHPRAEGRCLEFLHERCRYPDMEDHLERPVCSFCGARAQSPVPQGWFSAELEHVVDEDEEVTAVEVWEAVACADCEGQIRMTAEHLEAQGWQPIPGPL